jgi:hypothetical protein
VFVRLVNASNGRNVIAKVLVIASCIAILEVRRQPNAWSPYLSNVEPQIHFIVSAMMGRRSFRCTSSVNVSLVESLWMGTSVDYPVVPRLAPGTVP